MQEIWQQYLKYHQKFHLKDAASAAIYGSRANNGVIVSTTKSGKEGKSEVHLNFNTGVTRFANVGKIKMADSGLYEMCIRDSFGRGRQPDL